MRDWSCRRHRCDRSCGSNRSALAGQGTAAGDTPRLVVVMQCRLDGWRTDLDGRCRLDNSDRQGCGRRRGRRNRLDLHDWDHREHDRRLGLEFGLDNRWCGLLGGSLLHRSSVGGSVGGFHSLGRRCLLGRRLLDRPDFLRLLLTSQSITNRATFKPISLCLDEGARVRLHTHTHCVAQRHHFGVGHSELLGELVHAHVFRQNQFSLSLASACRSLFRRPLILSCW